MTNTTDFESVHPRADSGAFTDKAQGAPEQAPLAMSPEQVSVHDAQVTLDTIQKRYSAIMKDMHLANAKVIAAEILATDGNARYLKLEESDQEGCSWSPIGLTDADGFEIESDVIEELYSYASDLPMTVPQGYVQGESGWEVTGEPGYEWLIFDESGRYPKIDLWAARAIGE